MIQRFSDQAANERTYLAWIRTAIAIMALGFLVERLTVFLASRGTEQGETDILATVRSAEMAGLALLLAAVAMIICSTFRFLHYRKLIATEELRSYGGAVQEIILASLLVLIGVFLVAWMSHHLLPH